MDLPKLTFLGFYINGAAGSGKYDDISIEIVKEKIRNRSIFSFLKEKLNFDIDVSVLTEMDQIELLDEWNDIADNVDERRKFAVDQGGLTFLVAYLLEGLQRRYSKKN